MESFQIDERAERAYAITVEEASEVTAELVQSLVDIDLQTFAESTFSPYAAAAFLRNGNVYLLSADGITIGSCVCMRCFDRPHEAMVLSMGIRPGWRGRGLGQRFVSGVLERLKQRGLRSVSLYVSSDNRRAVKVYKDVGFHVVEEGPRDGETGASLQLMRISLQSEAPVVQLAPS